MSARAGGLTYVIHQADGKPFCRLRVSRRFHAAMQAGAAQRGVTFNAFLNEALRERLAALAASLPAPPEAPKPRR